MKNNTLYLPGFHLATLRRKPRSAAQKLADEKEKIRQHSISQLGECFGQFIPAQELEKGSCGPFSRRRLFSKENTFWGFFSQVLDADGGCQEVVRKVQAFAATRSMPVPSASTSAYCQARGKLDQDGLEKILKHTASDLEQRGRSRWWKDRRVVVVDGTGVSMADTPTNQERWPQPNSVTINTPGMRVKSFYLVTTLTDSTRYSAAELADLYYQRWEVELFFRDIKTTMGMDVLRCRTPALVRKEILMHFIAYNAVRLLIIEAANEIKQPPRRISFKASIQALRQWEPQLNRITIDQREQRRLRGLLRDTIAARLVIARPGRQEPRCVKRRPKPFALLTAPRHQMVEVSHRSRYRANVA